MAEFIIPKAGAVRIGNDGFHVVVQQDDKTLLIPWEAALEVAKAMTTVARKVEETAKAPGIIADQALLMRLGFPLGLTSNSDILSEAFKDAQHDPKLRKYITGPRAVGIPSSEAVGTPGLIQHEPKGGNGNGK